MAALPPRPDDISLVTALLITNAACIVQSASSTEMETEQYFEPLQGVLSPPILISYHRAVRCRPGQEGQHIPRLGG